MICGKDSIHIGCMPRSGSSLLRMMLDSHPKISAAPELAWLSKPQPIEILKKNYDKLVKPGQRFLGKEPRIITVNGLKLIKKTLGNDFYLIHIKRNPYDTLVSYAKTKTEINFDILAPDFIEGYEYLQGLNWDNWIEVKYEDLLKNPKETILELCGFLNLEYDPKMLEHHKDTHTAVDHYSDHQAKKPRFKTSMNQFDLYIKNGYSPTTNRVKLCEKLAKLLNYE